MPYHHHHNPAVTNQPLLSSYKQLQLLLQARGSPAAVSGRSATSQNTPKCVRQREH